MRRALLLAAAAALAGCEPEPPDLYAPPLPLVGRGPIPVPPKPPAPRVRPAPKLSPDEALSLIRRISELHRESWNGEQEVCHQCETVLGYDLRRHYLEADLFSRAYPDVTERFVLEILDDGDADWIELRLSMVLLRGLWKLSRPRIEAAVVDLMDHPDSSIAAPAIAYLASSGRIVRHRYALWEQCSRGRSAAFQMLSFEARPETLGLLEELRKRGRAWANPSSTFEALCDEALSRLRILQSPHWARTLSTLLEGPETGDWYWAREVARAKLPALARRTCFRIVREGRKAYDPPPPEPVEVWEDAPTPLPFAWRFVHETSIRNVGRYYDRELLEYAELGGELLPMEADRLIHFGFLGNPETRLLEILARRGERWGS